MKTNIVLSVLLSIFMLCQKNTFSQENDLPLLIKWKTFEQVGEEFLKNQKPILIFFNKPGCDSCKMMLDSVFSLPEVANYINIMFYPILFNEETREDIKFFDGTIFSNTGKYGKTHDLAMTLHTDSIAYPIMTIFTKQAQGNVYNGYKNRDHIFPVLIYYAEEIYMHNVDYPTYEKYYLKTYPPGQKQTMTRLLPKWKSLDEMQELQKQEPRKVLIDVSYNYRNTCTVQNLTTYNNPKIAEYLNKKYYCVTINAQTKDTLKFKGVTYINENQQHGIHQMPIAMLQGKMQFPAFLILDENLNLLDRIQMYLPPQKFEAVMKYYGDNIYKTKVFQDFEKDFKPVSE